MKPETRVLILAVLLAAAGSILGSTLTQEALATRNSSGTYSLPGGNPVTTGTTISSTWANNTLADIGTELTNSLDRGGRGAMTAPLQCSSGTVTSPSLTFSSETGSGLYRAGVNDIRMSVNQAAVEKWTTAGVTVTGNGTFNATSADAITANGAAAGNGVTAVGGSTSGEGGSFTGGSPNGTGLSALGVGTGSGVFSVGGNTSGTGGAFTGGTPNGIGGDFSGKGTGVAIRVGVGHALFNGGNPTSTTGFTNTQTPKNIIKGWGSFTTNGSGGNTINDGFNLTSVAVGSGNAVVTLATGMLNTGYAVIVNSSGASVPCGANNYATGTFNISCGATSLATTAVAVQYIIVGAQ